MLTVGSSPLFSRLHAREGTVLARWLGWLLNEGVRSECSPTTSPPPHPHPWAHALLAREVDRLRRRDLPQRNHAPAGPASKHRAKGGWGAARGQPPSLRFDRQWAPDGQRGACYVTGADMLAVNQPLAGTVRKVPSDASVPFQTPARGLCASMPACLTVPRWPPSSSRPAARLSADQRRLLSLVTTCNDQQGKISRRARRVVCCREPKEVARRALLSRPVMRCGRRAARGGKDAAPRPRYGP